MSTETKAVTEKGRDLGFERYLTIWGTTMYGHWNRLRCSISRGS